MEYKYEIISDHPLEIPESLRLDDGFADVIGKSLQVALQTGYAAEPDFIYLEHMRLLQMKEQRDEVVGADLRAIVVWYKPGPANPVHLGTSAILDTEESKAFETILEASTTIDGYAIQGKFRPDSWKNTHCRAQIFSQMGTTDYRSAELLASLYQRIELRDWSGLQNILSPKLDAEVPADLWSLPVKHTTDAESFITLLAEWRDKYDETWFDVTQAYVYSSRALVEFRIWDQGEIVGAALTEYSFEHIDSRPVIARIHNHSRGKGDVVGLDGSIQWPNESSALSA